MALAKSSFNHSRGFSLIEVLVSMGLLTVVSLGVAQLFALSTRTNHLARGQTSTTALAEQKMEQLRSMLWGFDTEGLGLPMSDTTTDISAMPPTQTGSGLNPSPTDSLEVNRVGFVDYLDGNGVWVGNGATPPGTAVFIRRWAIKPLPTNPNNTLILQVLVTPASVEANLTPSADPRVRQPGDTLLTTVRTRKAS